MGTIAQPMTGAGLVGPPRFAALPNRIRDAEPARIVPDLLTQALDASFAKVDVLTVSAWSELVPSLFCLFALLRPRRWVELGTHYGMSYFAACQAAADVGTECVAIDNWIGDRHASFHPDEVYESFLAISRNKFPDQLHIRANFKDAAKCFDDSSIDILHIDGYHTYAAAKKDFESWLPKMSSEGLVLFHDISVRERGFGVWRVFEELAGRYPSFSLAHSHGLGMIYVGEHPSLPARIMRWFHENPTERRLVQSFFEHVGSLTIDNRRQAEQLRQIAQFGPTAEAVPGLSDRQELVRQLYDARRRPMKTLFRHLKWKMNRAIDKLPLTQGGHERARRRIRKAAPDAV